MIAGQCMLQYIIVYITHCHTSVLHSIECMITYCFLANIWYMLNTNYSQRIRILRAQHEVMHYTTTDTLDPHHAKALSGLT
jgi:hypothetical protein